MALEIYADLDVINRTKRGLINGVGELSRMLFGTAIDEDVEDLRKKYNELASIASSNNKVIHLNCKQIIRLNQYVDDLAAYSKQLKTSITKVVSNVNSIYNVMVVN